MSLYMTGVKCDITEGVYSVVIHDRRVYSVVIHDRCTVVIHDRGVYIVDT